MVSAFVPIFFSLLLLGLPIFASLALADRSAVLFGGVDPLVVPMRMFSGMNNFSLMSIPFFILAAELMHGGLSDRPIDLAKALIGWLPGGLAAATVLACLFFGSISGPSPATVIAIGTIMYPAMVGAGYNKYFAIGLDRHGRNARPDRSAQHRAYHLRIGHGHLGRQTVRGRPVAARIAGFWRTADCLQLLVLGAAQLSARSVPDVQVDFPCLPGCSGMALVCR